MARLSLLIVATTLLLALVASNPIKKWSFPHYFQCDPHWGSDPMGVDGPGERSTICGEGCAMSSLSMALAGLSVNLPDGEIVTPGTMNQFLINNTLYHCAGGDCNNLQLYAPEAVSYRLKLIGELPKPPADVLRSHLDDESQIYLAHVRNNHHFVLLTGYTDNDNFLINDPNYNITTYPYANISDIIIYQIMNQPWQNVPNTNFPAYKQCDPQWGNDVIINQTICQVGCLMSSISMALYGNNIQIGGQNSTPASLNLWLRANGGYDDNNDLNEEVLPKLDSRVSWPADGMHRSNDLSIQTIRDYLLRQRVVIANVRNGRHFVLVVGFDYANSDTLLVHDPGFNVTTYSYVHDVVGWRIFDMQQQ